MKVCIHKCETDEYLAGDRTWQPLMRAVYFERVVEAVEFCGEQTEVNVEIVVSFGKKEEVHIPLHQNDC
ncbi:MAG: hypothetical protein JWM16_5533 [Verrucomicrobiales bacterium]|nr:hypothetical protein [Verrucomicrobiales bacterium]